MSSADRCCSLLFDEISLSSSLHYDTTKQKFIGYEDLGHLGRTIRKANHALVFMIRGLRRPWKQVLVYYFTVNTICTEYLKNLIFTLINQSQNIGLKVVSTVCDQGPTNQAAVTQLCAETNETKDQFYFNVNGEPVAILFDVPHLLKNTRNALLKSTFEFRDGKLAKFEYIKKAFELDQKKIYRQLLKLKPEHFKEGDSF